MGMVLSAEAGWCGLELNFWHPLHFWTNSLASSRAVGQKKPCRKALAMSALEEAKELVQKCKGCQMFRSKPLQPASALKTIPIAWPFAVWGLDMVGPFKTARGGLTHLLVAVDKFTKWIEAKPIKS